MMLVPQVLDPTFISKALEDIMEYQLLELTHRILMDTSTIKPTATDAVNGLLKTGSCW